MFHVAADDISFAATFFAKVTSRSFCRGSSPNRNRLRRIAIWFWGTDLKAKTSMPMRCPASGQSLFYSGSGGMASGSLRRGGCGFGKARGSRAGASAMAVTRKNCAGFDPKPAPVPSFAPCQSGAVPRLRLPWTRLRLPWARLRLRSRRPLGTPSAGVTPPAARRSPYRPTDRSRRDG